MVLLSVDKTRCNTLWRCNVVTNGATYWRFQNLSSLSYSVQSNLWFGAKVYVRYVDKNDTLKQEKGISMMTCVSNYKSV